jgi:hypothetical protein
VTSTILAHTAPYCVRTSAKTMAEWYHENGFDNSTLVLPHFRFPWLPDLETIAIPLPDMRFVEPACPSLVSRPTHSFHFVRGLEPL